MCAPLSAQEVDAGPTTTNEDKKRWCGGGSIGGGAIRENKCSYFVHEFLMNNFPCFHFFRWGPKSRRRQFGVARAHHSRCHRMPPHAGIISDWRTGRPPSPHSNVTIYFAFEFAGAGWLCVVRFLIEPLFSSVPFPEKWMKKDGEKNQPTTKGTREEKSETVCIFCSDIVDVSLAWRSKWIMPLYRRTATIDAPIK